MTYEQAKHILIEDETKANELRDRERKQPAKAKKMKDSVEGPGKELTTTKKGKEFTRCASNLGNFGHIRDTCYTKEGSRKCYNCQEIVSDHILHDCPYPKVPHSFLNKPI